MLLYFVVVNFVIHQLIRVVYILDRLYVQYMYIPFKAFFVFCSNRPFSYSSQNAKTRLVCTVAQKGHTCKLKMLLQTKNFTRKLKMLLQIKNRTCKLKIVHAN